MKQFSILKEISRELTAEAKGATMSKQQMKVSDRKKVSAGRDEKKKVKADHAKKKDK